MVNTTQLRQVKERMPVVGSNNEPFGMVDRLEADSIKLTKDKSGQHHWIPADWVQRVDDKVHIDRPGQQAMREWLTTPPRGM